MRPDQLFGGHMRWFGESWGAPVCEEEAHVPTPVGMVCIGHDHLHSRDRSALIEEGDQGITVPYLGGEVVETVAFHLECWLHEIGVPDARS